MTPGMETPHFEPAQRATLPQTVRAGFVERSGASPTVVTRAPGRVNLIGEHTDYNAGLCLPVALAHATYAAAGPVPGHEWVITTDFSDTPWQGTLDDAGPGRVSGWAAYAAGTLWALVDAGFQIPPLRIHLSSSVPVGAGLSSSAAIECAVATAALAIAEPGRPWDDAVREAIVTAAIRAETDVAQAPTGGMDQSIAMFGSRDQALLLDFARHSRTPVELGFAEADLVLLVIDTRVSHALNDGAYAERRAQCEQAARELGLTSLRAATPDAVDSLSSPLLARRARHVVSENGRVESVVEKLRTRSWPRLGELLSASHASLRDDFEVSCRELDLAVEVALAHGSLGARMTGGGFGGAALALLQRGTVDQVANAITAAFQHDSLSTPRFLVAEASAGAGLA